MKGKRELLHKYSPELQQELKDSFEILDDNYIRGVMFNEPTYNGRELVHHPPQIYNELYPLLLQYLDQTSPDKTHPIIFPK